MPRSLSSIRNILSWLDSDHIKQNLGTRVILDFNNINQKISFFKSKPDYYLLKK